MPGGQNPLLARHWTEWWKLPASGRLTHTRLTVNGVLEDILKERGLKTNWILTYCRWMNRNDTPSKGKKYFIVSIPGSCPSCLLHCNWRSRIAGHPCCLYVCMSYEVIGYRVAPLSTPPPTSKSKCNERILWPDDIKLSTWFTLQSKSTQFGSQLIF